MSTASPAPVVTACPKCGGEIDDHRAENRQRAARGQKLRPDYSCRDRACNWAQWPRKKGPAAPTRQAGEPREQSPEPAPAPQIPAPEARTSWAELDERYAACLAIAAYRLREILGPDVPAEAVQAGAATVLIAADRAHLSAPPRLARAMRERALRAGGLPAA